MVTSRFSSFVNYQYTIPKKVARENVTFFYSSKCNLLGYNGGMENNERYNEWLAGFKALLEASDLTQEELGGKVNKAREYINRILGEAKKAGEDLQDDISRALGFSHDNLRLFGRLLRKGTPKENVLVFAEILRNEKPPSVMTDEEWAIVQECMKAPYMEVTNLQKLADMMPCGIPVSWDSDRIRVNPPMPKAHQIPLLGRVPAGDPRQITDADILGWESVGPEIPGNAYALRVSGNSMRRPDDNNSISDGDTVIFVEKSDPAHNDMVVVCDEFGDVMLKRLKIKQGGEYVLASDNPAYEPIHPNGAYRIIGVVIDAHRKISVR